MTKTKTDKNKIVIGLVGEIAAGKDTAALYLKKKYQSETVSFSQPLRDILDIIGIEQSRGNLQDLGINLRKLFGQDILSRAIAEKIKTSQKKIFILPNVRLEQDIVWLKKIPKFILVALETDDEIRFARLKKRGQNTDDKSKTWTQFLKDGKNPVEKHIRELMPKCRYKLSNNGSPKELQKQIDGIMKKIK